MPRAVQFHEYGGPEQIRVDDMPPPVAGPGQVRIEVRSAGVNPFDWKVLAGLMAEVMPLELPSRPGIRRGRRRRSGRRRGRRPRGWRRGSRPRHLALDVRVSARRPRTAGEAPAATFRGRSRGALATAGTTAWGAIDRLGIIDGDTLLDPCRVRRRRPVRGPALRGSGSARDRNGRRGQPRTSCARSESSRSSTAKASPSGYRAIAPDGVDAVLDASGRGELPVSIELAGGTERVLTIADYDSAEARRRALPGRSLRRSGRR